MTDALLETVDDAVPDDLFRRVDRGVRAVGEDATYWRTFWYPLHTEPTCLPELLTRSLRRYIPEAERIVGVEWWLGRMRTTDVALDFHHDRDLALYEKTGRIAHPRCSSVYFLNAVRGGSLFVTDQRLLHRGDDYQLHPAEATRAASVRPAPNRFARFPGHCFHGVLDANDQVPSGKLSGPPASLRLTVILNWWRRKPLSVRRWDGPTYPELGL